MDAKERTRLSRRLSFVLRHRPDSVGVALDREGWAEVEALLAGLRDHGSPVSRAVLEEVVATNPKQRFAFSAEGDRIRAQQGHSIEVELGYEASEPPDVLFHGTVEEHLDAIREEGLRPMARHHVHLSADEVTARIVGGRRGRPVVLRVDARAMRSAGHLFFRSPNAVWLAAVVPSAFISGVERG